MPLAQRSLEVTDAYRDRLEATVQRAERFAETNWPTIEQLDDTRWVQRTANYLAGAQVEAVRTTSGYLDAFLTSELGTPTRGRPATTRLYMGLSRDGRPLTESLRSPLIGVLSDLKAGRPAQEALEQGKARALRMVEMDLMHAARAALNDLMAQSEHVEGWQRGVKGTCPACVGDIEVEVSKQLPEVPLSVHPHCKCVTVPVVQPRQPGLKPLSTRSVTAAEQQELQGYVEGFTPNVELRSGQVVDPKTLQTLDDLIADKGEFHNVLYRVADGSKMSAEQLDAEDFTDLAYGSCTTDKEKLVELIDLLGGEQPIVYKIRAGRGLSVDKHLDKEWVDEFMAGESQHEVILPRGSHFHKFPKKQERIGGRDIEVQQLLFKNPLPE